MKLPGPKTAVLSPSRMLPTAIDAAITPEDALLLEFAYSGEPSSTQLRAFFKTFGAEYGVTIPFAPLRHAIIAHFSIYLPREQFNEQHEYHKEQAWLGLAQRIKTRAQIVDADILTSLILARLAWDSGDLGQTMVHHNGCIAMLNFISESQEDKPLSSWLTVFAPYLHDILNFYNRIAIACATSPVSSQESLPPPRTTFRQRVRYFNELCRTRVSHLPGIWSSAIVETVHDYLDDLFLMLTTCVLKVGRKEMLNDFHRDWVVADVLQHVHAELDDNEFQRALEAVKQWSQANEELSSCQLRLLNLGTMALEAPFLLQGLGSPEANLESKWTISSFRTQFPRKTPIRSDRRDYYEPVYLSLAGMALDVDEEPERKQSHHDH